MPIINATIMIFTRTVLFLNNIMTITAVDREKKPDPRSLGRAVTFIETGLAISLVSYTPAASYAF
jgi:hypothetical protein